jgi:hypothetical protein
MYKNHRGSKLGRHIGRRTEINKNLMNNEINITVENNKRIHRP